MNGLIGGRTASDMPGLDIAEQKSWQNFLGAALRLYAVLNRRLVDTHQLSLADVRLLHILSNTPGGSARMGDLASTLPALPSRLTRQIRRLEGQELVRRDASPEDRRGVIATITDKGRMLGELAMVTYSQDVRANFLKPLSRPQIGALEDTCQRINAPLKRAERAAKDR